MLVPINSILQVQGRGTHLSCEAPSATTSATTSATSLLSVKLVIALTCFIAWVAFQSKSLVIKVRIYLSVALDPFVTPPSSCLQAASLFLFAPSRQPPASSSSYTLKLKIQPWFILLFLTAQVRAQTAASCREIKYSNSSATNDWYEIFTNTTLYVYCDMTTDGGVAYTMFATTSGGPSVSQIDSVQANGCTERGMTMIIPRTQAHWDSMFNFVTNTNLLGSSLSTYFHTVPGIAKPVGGVTSCNGGGFGIMNSGNCSGQWPLLLIHMYLAFTLSLFRCHQQLGSHRWGAVVAERLGL